MDERSGNNQQSDERKMKRFRQAVTGNRLMTESQIRKMKRNALIQQSLSSSHLKVSIKQQKSQCISMFNMVSPAGRKFHQKGGQGIF